MAITGIKTQGIVSCGQGGPAHHTVSIITGRAETQFSCMHI